MTKADLEKRKEHFRQAHANAALEGLTPPEKTAWLREQFLAGKLSFKEFKKRLDAHYGK